MKDKETQKKNTGEVEIRIPSKFKYFIIPLTLIVTAIAISAIIIYVGGK